MIAMVLAGACAGVLLERHVGPALRAYAPWWLYRRVW